MNKVFLETGFTGHHVEYTLHIIDFLSERKIEKKYLFLFSSNLLNELEKKRDLRNFFVETVTNNDAFKTITNLCEVSIFPIELVIMNLEEYNLEILRTHLPKNLKISGIWFKPIHNIPINSIRTFFFVLNRFFYFNILYTRQNFERIFLLNEDEIGLNKNKVYFPFCWRKFSALADPIDTSSYNKIDNIDSLKKEYRIGLDCKVFGIFGVIDYRKNVELILNSIKDIETDKSICILICGKVREELRFVLEKGVDGFDGIENIQIKVIDKFLSTIEFDKLMQITDVILMPYNNFYYSSGILGHALLREKLVITSKFGLIGRIVNNEKLGFVVDPRSKINLTNIIKKILYSDYCLKINSFSFYLKRNSYENFCIKILF